MIEFIMDEYLKEKVMKRIYPLGVLQYNFPETPPLDREKDWEEINNFNFGQDKGLKKILNWFNLN